MYIINVKIIDNNKKAYHDYYIEETFEAGVELLGWEVKSARSGGVSLAESFVVCKQKSEIRNQKSECFLKNAHFSPYENGVVAQQDLRRDRRLLLNRAQIEKISKGIKVKGCTCVATKIYFNNRGRVKCEVALAKGKHNFDKKQVLKERDLQREAHRSIIR